jgi:hypothetical protein
LIGGVRRCGRIAFLQYLMDTAFSRLHILRSWLGDRFFAMSDEELVTAGSGLWRRVGQPNPTAKHRSILEARDCVSELTVRVELST